MVHLNSQATGCFKDSQKVPTNAGVDFDPGTAGSDLGSVAQMMSMLVWQMRYLQYGVHTNIDAIRMPCGMHAEEQRQSRQENMYNAVDPRGELSPNMVSAALVQRVASLRVSCTL